MLRMTKNSASNHNFEVNREIAHRDGIMKLSFTEVRIWSIAVVVILYISPVLPVYHYVFLWLVMVCLLRVYGLYW